MSLLVKMDRAWNNLLSGSASANVMSGMFAQLQSFFSKNDFCLSLGKILKWLSILLSSILFVCLALPQFVNDKLGLAAILIAAFISWFIGKLLTGTFSLKGNFVDALILLFFGINIVATCASHYFSASMHGLLKVFIYILTYFLFCSQIKEKPKLQFWFSGILIFSAALLSVYGLYQYKIGVAPLATWEDPTLEHQATRIYATFNNPNLFAAYLLPIVMVVGSLIFPNCKKNKWIFSIFLSFLSILLTGAIILTGSRGAYIGLFAGFASLILVVLSKIRLMKNGQIILISALALIPLAVLIVFHYMPGFEQRLVSIFAGREHSSNSFRLNVWLSSLSMLKDNWLIGIGVGNQAFCLAYGLYMRTGFDALGTYCVPLEIAVETGIFGLISFALFICALLYRAHIIFWSSDQPGITASSKWLSTGFAVALIALLAHGLVDTVFFRPQIQFVFYLAVAIIIANSDFKNNKTN